MINRAVDDAMRIRILESWLPLAQELNQEREWGYDSSMLQALILLALPSLMQACSASDARAILKHMYDLQRSAQS